MKELIDKRIFEEESGGVYLFVLAGSFSAVILLGMIFNMANQAIVKISLQGTADSAVMAGASWIAGGLNILAFFNWLMMFFLSLLVALVLILIALTACTALWFLPILAAACGSVIAPYINSIFVPGVKTLWQGTYAIEEVENFYAKTFPLISGMDAMMKLNQIGSPSRESSLKEPKLIIFPIIPSFDLEADGIEILSLHVKKGKFDDLSKGVEDMMTEAVNKILGFLPGGGIAGKVIGWVGGKAVGMAGEGLGELINKVSKGGKIEGKKESFETIRTLAFDNNPSLKNTEEGYEDPDDACNKSKCEKILEFLKSVENPSEEGVSVKIIERFRKYEVTKTKKSGEFTFKFITTITIDWDYYHFKWHLNDEDVDGDGKKEGDGCRRRWFTGAKTGEFSPYKKMEDAIERVYPSWLDLQGISCRDFDREIKQMCDGKEYVIEKYIFRKAQVKVRTDVEMTPPQRLPAPLVLHEDVPQKLRIAALAYEFKTREPSVFKRLFKKGSPLGTFAISQACVKDFSQPPAKGGEIFYRWNWKEFLCPVTVLGELVNLGSSHNPEFKKIEEALKNYVLLH